MAATPMTCHRCGLPWKPGVCPHTCTDHRKKPAAPELQKLLRYPAKGAAR